MAKYLVNKHGDHEVHTESCGHRPLPQNSEHLGEFSSCKGAVAAAKKSYSKANGCFHCSKECHTG
jgi:hypothetical protein